MSFNQEQITWIPRGLFPLRLLLHADVQSLVCNDSAVDSLPLDPTVDPEMKRNLASCTGKSEVLPVRLLLLLEIRGTLDDVPQEHPPTPPHPRRMP